MTLSGPFNPSKPPVPYLSIAQKIMTKSVNVGEPLCGPPDRAATLACRSTSARRHGGPPLQKINVVRQGVGGKIPFSCFMSDLFVTMNFFHEIDLSCPNLKEGRTAKMRIPPSMQKMDDR